MDDGIKQRLIGAVFLVALMIIFLPMLFGDRNDEAVDILIEMPAKPVIPEFDISKPLEPNKQHSSKQHEVEKAGVEVIRPEVKLGTKHQADKDRKELADKKVDANNLPVSWTLQVASFKNRSNAEKLRDKLRQGNYKAYIKFRPDVEPQMIRVFVGPVLEHKIINSIKASINTQYKLDGLVIRYLP